MHKIWDLFLKEEADDKHFKMDIFCCPEVEKEKKEEDENDKSGKNNQLIPKKPRLNILITILR